IHQFNERSRREARLTEELELLRSAEPITIDGQRLVLRANVDFPEESDFAARSGADGVGLMRTEFLVVGRTTMPDEEEQFRAYKRVAESFHGAPVVIRTYDIGGDKLPVGGHPTEANPFLGWRAIRMCLDEPEMFKTQLRALMRAASFGDVRIMLPLVVSTEEVRSARALILEGSLELQARGIAHRSDLPVGVMIETPAAAVAADSFVGDASFFSIGTNDLTQYTLAIDRGNANLAPRFTPLHPAVLRLIQRTVEVGAKNGIEVTVCGEMASQPLTAYALIGLGVRTMSVAPRSMTLLKRLVRGTDARVAAVCAGAALAARTAAESEAIIFKSFAATFGDIAELFDGLP
ncbi:MAG TPA: putative PEP-binding protein, partial [Gemmatimonadaceae bacterium]